MKAAVGPTLALMLSASAAYAEEPASDAGLVWKSSWRAPAWYDYAIGGGLVAGATVELFLPVGNDAKNTGGILLDDAVRDGFVLESEGNRSAAKTLADVSMVALAAYPAVDAGVVALAVHDSPGVAWNMAFIDLQAFAFASLTTGAVKRIVDRERPVGTVCRDNPDYDASCESADNHLSFPSGHSSIAFTGASLTCLHHLELELYGGDADSVACVSALTLATLVGTSRIAADKHYLSDVVSGATIGAVSGWLLPWLIYYQAGNDEELGASDGGGNYGVLAPRVSGTELGVTWMGAF